MRKILLIAMLLVTAYGSAFSGDDSVKADSGQVKTPAPTAEKAGYEVKILKNNVLLTTFKTADEDALLALFVKDQLSIRLISPDQKQTIAIHVPGGKAGYYVLAQTEETKVQFQSEEPLINWTAIEKGELKLTESTDTHCSGSFYGMLPNDRSGNSYTIEGTFNKIPVRKIQPRFLKEESNDKTF